MDAHALLTSQGWRGTGHSLHASDDKVGLSKPLLLNRRDGTKGLGQKPHFTSDMWWMDAFDEQLQGLSTTTTKEGKVGVVQAVTAGRINSVEKGMGGRWKLGGSFVKGGFLQGTVRTSLGETSSGDTTPVTTGEESDRISVREEENDEEQEKGERDVEDEESKEERRARRAQRREEREKKRQRKESKRKATGGLSGELSQQPKTTGSENRQEVTDKLKRKDGETKEERRARKAARRLRREGRNGG